MTFTLTDVLLLIIAAAAVVAAVILIRLAGQLARTAAEVEQVARHFNYLRPRFEHLIEETEAELGEIRSFTKRADRIAGDVEAVSEQARKIALPALVNIGALAEPLRYAGAALMGAKVGLKVLKGRKKKQEDEE